jgi:hypothetical protein
VPKYRLQNESHISKTAKYPDIMLQYEYEAINGETKDALRYFEIDLDQFKNGSFLFPFDQMTIIISNYSPIRVEIGFDFKSDCSFWVEGMLDEVTNTINFSVVTFSGIYFHSDELKDFIEHLREKKEKVIKQYQKYSNPDYIKKIIAGVEGKEKELSFLLKEPSSI